MNNKNNNNKKQKNNPETPQGYPLLFQNNFPPIQSQLLWEKAFFFFAYLGIIFYVELWNNKFIEQNK